MGGTVTKILTKPIKSFNIVSRTEKLLEQEKPSPHPTYPSTIRQLKVAEKVNPDFIKEHNTKDEKLHDRLKEIFVMSHTKHESEKNEKTRKKLPHPQSPKTDWNYSFWDSKDTVDGRSNLKTILKFMSDHMVDPKTNSTEAIASEHKLDPKDVANILQYYKILQVAKDPDGRLTASTQNLNQQLHLDKK